MAEQTSFEKLYNINVNEKTEQKNGLTYLSWAWAWAEFKKVHPNATYEVKKFENGLPYVYDENTGYMVFTSVTVDGLTHEMWLPVMDGNNKAMKDDIYEYSVKNPKFKYAKWNKDAGKYLDNYGNEQKEYLTKYVQAATMFDVNKTIMRCLTKNLAMFGLGLYIYAGEDLPEDLRSDDDKIAEIKQLIQETNTDTKKFLYSMGVKFKRELGAVDELKGEEIDFALGKIKEKQKALKESEGK